MPIGDRAICRGGGPQKYFSPLGHGLRVKREREGAASVCIIGHAVGAGSRPAGAGRDQFKHGCDHVGLVEGR